ncbi:family 20 glycosylhydrolase [Granulicella sp. WH15]|uniref:beta-N-acetylhexosaminidase n=1 Tax=Granulicella sp. WH15 TaxID=2602070 RepID=UPI0013675B80|nr:beta-N-acetylhexosaminidase [Granulicella sp. WH15]QHN03866.1 family 20 glycosylhydrolase [Granulicella sp. WH15]
MSLRRPALPSPAFAAILLAAALPSAAQTASLKLIPMPRELHVTAADIPLSRGIRILCASCSTDSDDAFAVQELTQTLAIRAVSTSGAYPVQLVRSQSLPAEMKPEGYTIATTAQGLTITAATAEGLFYGIQTLKQLIEHDGSAAVLHAVTVRDWPAMKYRGVQDDLSRGPVDTLEFQKKLVRTLAAYKVNLYSPYFEHIQEYASNPLPAPPGGAMTAADARALVAYAKPYHVLVVPEQEAFGHLHHNLTWEQYSAVAETPHGNVLAPAQPGSVAYIQQMFTELAALYPGPFLHIGADETADLGIGQTKADVDTRGLGPVYLDFLQKVTTALQPLNRRILFWGDIAQEVTQTSPMLLKNLPESFKRATIAIPWWYAPSPKGYDKYITPFTSAGFETWVAPGVGNWSRVYPNQNDALANIQGFVRDGQRLGATGELNTIWYDDGESLASNNWYGLLFGAAAGWQQGESSIPAFEQSYAQVFHGDATGALNQAQIELMAAHDLLRNQAKVGDGSDGLFWIDPFSKDGQKNAEKIRPYLHDLRLHAERALTLIAQAKQAAGPATHPAPETRSPGLYDAAASGAAQFNLREPDAIDALELGARRFDFIGLKFQLADEIVDGYNRALANQTSRDKKTKDSVGRDLSEINGINGRLHDVIDTYSLLRDMYASGWLRTNRSYALRPVLEHYDYTINLWFARSDKFRAAQRQWSSTQTLPSPNDLGLPLR